VGFETTKHICIQNISYYEVTMTFVWGTGYCRTEDNEREKESHPERLCHQWIRSLSLYFFQFPFLLHNHNYDIHSTKFSPPSQTLLFRSKVVGRQSKREVFIHRTNQPSTIQAVPPHPSTSVEDVPLSLMIVVCRFSSLDLFILPLK
jgi:hypothetical protein